ncbi:transglutaminase-like domain-containing protein [Parabacteroides goldsteinii]|nr:transglutaminase-like domain-containing protein [Parabacteroides goldsteinii]
MKTPFCLTIIILLYSCSAINDRNFEFALKAGRENRGELKKTLNSYKENPLKLRAAKFLILNMPYHYSLEEYFISPQKEEYHPNFESMRKEVAVKEYCDSLLKCGYKIHKQKKYDISTLDSRFLIDNIELAFTVWQKPWAKNVSFNDFCKYILPYRAQCEEVSHLRREIMERFVPILDSAKVKTPLEACFVLNEHLKGIMKYGHTGLPFYPTIDETYRSGISQCEGLCNLGTFIMRACGIPVTVEQTTWTKMDLGHIWCVVLDNGKFYSFGPGEDQPDTHARSFSEVRHRRPAKVYRSRFDPDFSIMDKKDDGYVTILKSPLIYDVTNEYLDKTTLIKVSVDKNNGKKGKSNQVYLCTYNYYEWCPIAIGHRKDTVCYFENVVGDNIFMVADSPDGNKLRNITAPFYTDKDGNIRKFIPQKEHKQSFTLNKRKKKLDQEHTLHFWDTEKERFIPLEYASSTDTTQTYDQIPTNALLWFTIPERIVNQRIFFIENDSIKSY